jgi:hypothetical protein
MPRAPHTFPEEVRMAEPKEASHVEVKKLIDAARREFARINKDKRLMVRIGNF